MLKSYHYIFYSIYEWNKRVTPKSEQPELNAMLALSFLIFCNLVLLSILIELTIGFKLISFEGISAITVMSIIVGIIVMNYFLLVHRRRYISIIEKYKQTGKTKAANGFVLFYIIASLFTLIFLLFYIAIGKA
jgi:hypothetical protein